MAKKAIVSACLLGEYCRYDGKAKQNGAVLEHFKGYEIIPFCPEAPLFGTPRQRISVIKTPKGNRIITDETKEDVTPLLEKEILSFIEKNRNVDAICLKSKSPSCGYGTTPILDKNGEKIAFGNGIAVDIFLNHYSTKIISELEC